MGAGQGDRLEARLRDDGHIPPNTTLRYRFRAVLPEPRFGVGSESLEVELVEPTRIPWDEIAFPSIRYALERYLGDRQSGSAGLHFHAIDLRRPDLPET